MGMTGLTITNDFLLKFCSSYIPNAVSFPRSCAKGNGTGKLTSTDRLNQQNSLDNTSENILTDSQKFQITFPSHILQPTTKLEVVVTHTYYKRKM